MARQKKQGIDYFSLDCDFFSDRKIKILKSRYGADGITIFIYLLCEIYRNGYYIIVDDDFYYIVSDDLNMNSDKVKQVLTFLLERSMFDKQLFQSDAVLTSAGIQKRFQLAVKTRAKKNPIKVDRFWLLNEEETEPFIKCTHFSDLSEIKESYSRKNDCNSTEKSLKKSKVKNIDNILGFSPELEQAFQMYILVRSNNYGDIIPEQIQALREDLIQLSDSEVERIAIVKKATAGGWKSFYKTPCKEKQSRTKKAAVKDNNNFKRRQYDMDDLENRLLGR